MRYFIRVFKLSLIAIVFSIDLSIAEVLDLKCNITAQDDISIEAMQIIEIKCDGLEDGYCEMTSDKQINNWPTKINDNQLLLYFHSLHRDYTQSRILHIDTTTGKLTGAIVTFSEDDANKQFTQIVGVCLQ